MRREGRQRGWVRVYDRAMVDPEGKRRVAHVVDGSAVVVANGGYIRGPRKPTNQSKSGGLRRALARSDVAEEDEEEVAQVLPPYGARSGYYFSTTRQSPFKYEAGKRWQWQYDCEEVHIRPAPAPAAARFVGRSSCKGSRKFKHHEIKAYFLDGSDAGHGDYFDS